MNPRFTQAITLAIGISIGAAGIHVLTPAAASEQMTMPMGTGMMSGMHMPSDCSKMHAAMMTKIHSPADRSMMQGMMGMHAAMDGMKMTGNADRDFMTMMIPHHRAAVMMARSELQYGKDPRVRALANRIISAQRNEIAEMTSWLQPTR